MSEYIKSPNLHPSCRSGERSLPAELYAAIHQALDEGHTSVELKRRIPFVCATIERDRMRRERTH